MRHFKRATHARGDRRGYRYNLQLPPLPLALPSAATRRNHKAVYDHSCSQSVGPPARGNGVCVSACADRNREDASSAAVPMLPTRLGGETATTMRHCIVAKTYEARNKIYVVVFLNARAPLSRDGSATVYERPMDTSCQSICQRARDPASSKRAKAAALPHSSRNRTHA